jgi:hypothetical protein
MQQLSALLVGPGPARAIVVVVAAAPVLAPGGSACTSSSTPESIVAIYRPGSFFYFPPKNQGLLSNKIMPNLFEREKNVSVHSLLQRCTVATSEGESGEYETAGP